MIHQLHDLKKNPSVAAHCRVTKPLLTSLLAEVPFSEKLKPLFQISVTGSGWHAVGESYLPKCEASYC